MASLPAARVPALLVALLVAALQHDQAAAHGILTIPASRNWLAWLGHEKFDWPDGLSAGGYKVVGQNGGVKWPNGKHPLCGDRPEDNGRFSKPGRIQNTYKAGQTIEAHFIISTNHYGRIETHLCPEGATEDKQCTKLQRADGKGEAWDLPAVVQGARFNGGALGENLRPMQADPSYSWYPQPHIDCSWWPYCNRYDGMPVYKLSYKLPAGVKCERCMLRWYYLTGHKCHPPCLKSDVFYPDCRSHPKFKGTYLATMDYCGTEWSAYPEEFWNCADIAIK